MKKQIGNKLEKLKNETDVIFNDLQGISLEDLTKKGKGWSIIEVLSHLELTERASLGYMKKKIQAGDNLPKGKAIYRLKMWFTVQFLKSNLKWKAPGVVSKPDGNFTLDEIQIKWNQTRSQITDFISKYPDKWLSRAVYKHPMAGRQSLVQTLDSFIYHQRHHVHQIKRIRKELHI